MKFDLLDVLEMPGRTRKKERKSQESKSTGAPPVHKQVSFSSVLATSSDELVASSDARSYLWLLDVANKFPCQESICRQTTERYGDCGEGEPLSR